MGAAACACALTDLRVPLGADRAVSNSTNANVVWWAVIECLLLVVLTVGQVYYLRRFFEVKRVI